MTVELGKIVGAWGIKGWIKLHSYTRQRQAIAEYSSWWLQAGDDASNRTQYQVEDCRAQGSGIVAKLQGVDDRDQALALAGQKILVDKSDLPSLPQGEYYWYQLIGLVVVDLSGKKLGRVDSIIETGANDVLVCKPDEDAGGSEFLVPYTKQVVDDVDLQAGVLRADWDPAYLQD